MKDVLSELLLENMCYSEVVTKGRPGCHIKNCSYCKYRAIYEDCDVCNLNPAHLIFLKDAKGGCDCFKIVRKYRSTYEVIQDSKDITENVYKDKYGKEFLLRTYDRSGHKDIRYNKKIFRFQLHDKRVRNDFTLGNLFSGEMAKLLFDLPDDVFLCEIVFHPEFQLFSFKFLHSSFRAVGEGCAIPEVILPISDYD